MDIVMTQTPDREALFASLICCFEGMAYRRQRQGNEIFLSFVSDGCLGLTGYRPDVVLKQNSGHFEHLVFSDDAAMVEETLDSSGREGCRFHLEYRIVHADGSIRWVSDQGLCMTDAQGQLRWVDGFMQDITDRKACEYALIEAEQRHQAMVEHAVGGIFQSSPDGRYLRANPALARMWGYDSPQQLLEAIRDIGTQLYVDPARRDTLVATLLRDGTIQNFESQVYRRDQQIIWISESARVVRDARGELLYFEGIIENISERKRYEARIDYQAAHDALTGLPNRNRLRELLQRAIERQRLTDEGIAILYVDLDHFKHINESIGQVAGDAVIRIVAERLSRLKTKQGVVARVGADEFLMIVEAAGDTEAVQRLASAILTGINQPFEVAGQSLQLTCSIGVSVYPEDGDDADTLLRHADSAMDAAKQAGRNLVRTYAPHLHSSQVEKLELINKLRRALNEQAFTLAYQPKIALESGEVIGAEALIRWTLPNGENVPPVKFIPLAEETGLIEPIGRWVLHQACRDACRWMDLHPSPVIVSVNVSPRQFRSTDLVRMVESVLAESGLPPELLELEITESCLADDTGRFVHTLSALHQLGVSLSIDDFGTGYSSMSYLKEMPVECLKIDRSFVNGLESDAASRAILRAIISLGHNLGIKVLAEGVETEVQRDFLQANLCDEAQGYLFGKPMPLADFQTRFLQGMADAQKPPLNSY